MDNTAQTNNLQLIENKLKKLISKLKEDSSIDIQDELLELEKQNDLFKQKIITNTAALMQQRRKATQNVDDQYFEHEIFIEAHDELDREIKKLLEVL